MVVDVNGWFALAANQPDGSVTVLDHDEASISSGGAGSGGAVLENATPLSVEDLVVVSGSEGNPYYGRVIGVNGTSVTIEEVALADIPGDRSVTFDR